MIETSKLLNSDISLSHDCWMNVFFCWVYWFLEYELYRGNHKDAVRSYKAATDINKTNGQGFLRLGNCLFALESLMEAELAFKTALEVKSATIVL